MEDGNITSDKTERYEDNIDNLKRKIKQLELDNQMLAVINQNTEQLRKSFEAEKKLQYFYNDLLLDNCPNMIFLFNDQLNLEICSSSCKPFLAYEEVIDAPNLHLLEVFSNQLNKDWLNKIYIQNMEAFNKQTSFKYDDTIIFDNERFIYAQIMISPIIDDQNNCRGTMLTINDVTELVVAKHEMEEAARSKSRFLANMSHEIRTPMNAVKGLSELLSLTELNDTQKNYVANIINASDSLLGIINDVLDFTKIDANKIELVEAEYDLSDLITGVCNVVNMKADEKSLVLLVEASPELPVSLWGDEARIKQIMTNFLSNAVKYTNKGYIRLILKIEKCEEKTSSHSKEDKDWLVCLVEDTGIGIKEEDIPELFNAFSRVDLHTNRNITGTGLGLAISKQLTAAMGGEVFIESRYGKGSTFGFRVPQKIVDRTFIAKVNHKENKKVLLLESGIRLWNIVTMLDELSMDYIWVRDIEELADAELSGFTHCIIGSSISEDVVKSVRNRLTDVMYVELRNMINAADMPKYQTPVLYLPLIVTDLAGFLNDTKHILIGNDITVSDDISVQDVTALVVDDNEINLMVGGEMLINFDINVMCSESGAEAIELCRKHKFDIIFMDQMMPGMDGVEATHHIRRQVGLNNSTPIIALTANVINDMKSYYLSNEIDDFIGKPMELADLRRVLVKWLPEEKIIWL